MSKAIGRIYGVGTRSPYGYETDYMKYLQGYNPYIYGGAEILGATIAGKYFSPYVAPVITGIGYANNVNDIPINIGKNAVVSKFTRGIQKIPLLPQNIRDLGQNTASWYLLDKESQGK